MFKVIFLGLPSASLIRMASPKPNYSGLARVYYTCICARISVQDRITVVPTILSKPSLVRCYFSVPKTRVRNQPKRTDDATRMISTDASHKGSSRRNCFSTGSSCISTIVKIAV
jgi:hypothetical protein